MDFTGSKNLEKWAVWGISHFIISFGLNLMEEPSHGSVWKQKLWQKSYFSAQCHWSKGLLWSMELEGNHVLTFFSPFVFYS